MKQWIFITGLFLLTTPINGQEQSILKESLTGMFDVQAIDLHMQIQALEGVQGPLNPAVPLDGGVVALVAAGAAIGYRKLNKKQYPVQ